MANINRPEPYGAKLEGGSKPAKEGRPRKRLPMSSILKVLKGIEDTAMEGRSPDASLSRKILADYACINLERALMADDDEIPLKHRADMALRIGPVIAMLETLIPKDTGKGMPKTESAVDQEIQRRLGSLNALIRKSANVPVEKVLDTLAPAAGVTPEEA
jgi:hypothetical protein